MIKQEFLQKAANYSSRDVFIKYNREMWLEIMKQEQGKLLTELFKSGEIYKHKAEKVDRRLKKNRDMTRTHDVDIINEMGRHTHAKAFLRRGGVYAEAALRRHSPEWVEEFYATAKTTDQIMDQAHRCTSLEEFKAERPHYYAQAKARGLIKYLDRFYTLPPSHADLIAEAAKYESFMGFKLARPHYANIISRNGLSAFFERHFKARLQERKAMQ